MHSLRDRYCIVPTSPTPPIRHSLQYIYLGIGTYTAWISKPADTKEASIILYPNASNWTFVNRTTAHLEAEIPFSWRQRDVMEEEQPQVSSTWPSPPPFWRNFTPGNLSRVKELQKQQADRDGVQDVSSVRLSHLPRALRNLQPPSEPADGVWKVFGDTYRLQDELPRLEDMGIRRLFPNPEDRDRDGKHFDRALILKRLAKSLLLNFLELVGLLAANPGAADGKVNDIRDIIINFHHLINEYRPHQARESLITMMQSQLDQTRAETNAIRDAKDKAERVMEGLGSLKVEDDLVSSLTATQEKPLWNYERETWTWAMADV
ncbi:MED7 protein-domain-containing protein [Hypoxylon sp. FL1284]|nr:MED7 protein-domain-containing protein [Hypoxylon sp. FL1284]